MRSVVALGVVAVMALSGCSSLQPLQQDQPLVLDKGQGIAVVQMNTLDDMSNVQLVAENGDGATLDIPTVPVGKSLYLFVVPAGSYCMQRFNYGRILIFNKGEKNGCFQVPAGQLGFSGEFEPRGQGGGVYMGQNLDVAASQAALKQAYPRVAAQFLQPEPEPQPMAAAAPTPAPAATGNEQVSGWIDQSKPGVDSIYFRNNTQWTIKFTLFALYDCANIQQACKPEHPDFKLAPRESRKYMDVLPADPHGAYSFRYRIEYGFDMSRPKKLGRAVAGRAQPRARRAVSRCFASGHSAPRME